MARAEKVDVAVADCAEVTEGLVAVVKAALVILEVVEALTEVADADLELG